MVIFHSYVKLPEGKTHDVWGLPLCLPWSWSPPALGVSSPGLPRKRMSFGSAHSSWCSLSYFRISSRHVAQHGTAASAGFRRLQLGCLPCWINRKTRVAVGFRMCKTTTNTKRLNSVFEIFVHHFGNKYTNRYFMIFQQQHHGQGKTQNGSKWYKPKHLARSSHSQHYG